jgi:thiamine transport system substrate-binding protein
MRFRHAAFVLAATLVLAAACGDDDATSDGPPDGPPRDLVLLTHDSFDATEAVIEAFEAQQNATVTVLQGGDANTIVNRAILNAGNPEADVLFGVDNLTYQRAVAEGVFEEYEAKARDQIPEGVLDQFGGSEAVTPIDYGFVVLNLDRAAGDPPASLEELTDPVWKGRLVVEDPATSSPGLQFLASTVAHFGEGGDYTWRDFWSDLRSNDVLVTDGWSEAYYTHFTLAGGDRPLVVSYTTSPAAEVFFGELPEPPTANVVTGPVFRQVEAAAVLDGTDEPELARAFIDFMLSSEFQAQIPETMFVYPVLADTPKPEWWQWAEPEPEAATLEASQDDIDRWIEEWTEVMRR